MRPWLPTATGKRFHPLEPDPAVVDVRDIAIHLSRTFRYGGCVRLSVAEHSVLVSRVCKPENALWGLLHDAAEAYLGDIPRPLKHSDMFDAYRRLEGRWDAAVWSACGLYPASAALDDVHHADMAVFNAECRLLFPDIAVEMMDPGYPIADVGFSCFGDVAARELFMRRYEQLTGTGSTRLASVTAKGTA